MEGFAIAGPARLLAGGRLGGRSHLHLKLWLIQRATSQRGRMQRFGMQVIDSKEIFSAVVSLNRRDCTDLHRLIPPYDGASDRETS